MKLDAWSQNAYEQMNPRWREHGQFLGRRNFRAVLRLGRRYLKGRILDAGCGDGTMVHALRTKIPGAAVTGVDIAPACVDDGIVAGRPHSGFYRCYTALATDGLRVL
jgi:2-polyprenyl-3-methyl-5-hydroxy-6-metoxy-1,4-benzoquinol methylase